MSDLAGKVALVTGASRGISRAVAVALARAGADVAVPCDSREDDARESVTGQTVNVNGGWYMS